MSGDEKVFVDAAANGDTETVCRLLAKGVAVDVRSGANHVLAPARNVTALMLAAAGGYLETVEVLLKAGADISTEYEAHKTEGSGSQSLQEAIQRGRNAVAEMLLDAGADPNVVGNCGRTPLTAAIWNLNLDGVKLLLKRGADPKIKTRRKDYSSPMCVAARVSMNDKFLVNTGTEIVVIPEKKAIIYGLFDLLLAAGADPDGRDVFKKTALHTLCGGDVPALNLLRVPLIEKLMKAGAGADLVDEKGGTPVELAVLFNNTEIIRLLCQKGVDVNRVFRRGTMLDIAGQTIESCEKSFANASLPAFFHDEAKRRLPLAQEIVKILLEHDAKRKSELPADMPAPATSVSKPAKKAAIGAAIFLNSSVTEKANGHCWRLKLPSKKLRTPSKNIAGQKHDINKSPSKRRRKPKRSPGGVLSSRLKTTPG